MGEKQIKFNTKFYIDIQSNTKTKTIRKTDKNVKPGESVTAKYVNPEGKEYDETSNIYHPTEITIISIRMLRVCDLTDEDAKQDGFENLQLLFNELITYYPDLKLNDIVYQIEFRLEKNKR